MGRDEDKNKKKITKKTIDIESEFIGKPVYPKQKKEKKDDLTDEIKKFINEPIDLDSIKRIFLRFRGQISDYELQRSKLFIYGIPKTFNSKRNVSGFLIKIDTCKRSYIYYLSWLCFFEIDAFGSNEIYKSMLKQEMAHVLRNWLENNLEKINVLDG